MKDTIYSRSISDARFVDAAACRCKRKTRLAAVVHVVVDRDGLWFASSPSSCMCLSCASDDNEASNIRAVSNLEAFSFERRSRLPGRIRF